MMKFFLDPTLATIAKQDGKVIIVHPLGMFELRFIKEHETGLRVRKIFIDEYAQKEVGEITGDEGMKLFGGVVKIIQDKRAKK